MAAKRKPAFGLDPKDAAGPPEQVVKEKRLVGRSPQGEGRSYTGQFLKPVLARKPAAGKRRVEAAE